MQTYMRQMASMPGLGGRMARKASTSRNKKSNKKKKGRR
jgi:hypothetical protein